MKYRYLLKQSLSEPSVWRAMRLQQPGVSALAVQSTLLRRVYLVGALLGAAILLLISANPAFAEAPTSFRVYPQALRDVGSSAAEETIVGVAGTEAQAASTRLRIIIDADPGVDDAAALGWALLQNRNQVNILGIVATAGNAALEEATHNALLIRELARRKDVPVFMGETDPLDRQLSSTGKLIHGIDGLWSAAAAYPQKLNLAKREAAWSFYCRMGRNERDVTIVALGPLTNVGQALRSCPTDMLNFKEIIILGGAKFGGNTTPVAEFNIWQDPEAAQLVFTSGMNITLVPLDTFTSLQFDIEDVFALAASGGPVAQFLSCAAGVCPTPFPTGDEIIDGGVVGLSPLGLYLGTQLQAVGEASIPDLAAMMYALDSSLALHVTTGLAKVILQPELARGQTIIGVGLSEKITMIADDRELSDLAEDAYADPLVINGIVLPNPDIIGAGIFSFLTREPDNVKIVTSIDVPEMRARFFATLLTQTAHAAGMDVVSPATLAPLIPQLFAPVMETQD